MSAEQNAGQGVAALSSRTTRRFTQSLQLRLHQIPLDHRRKPVARYLFESIGRRDFPPIIGVNILVALTIVFANLVVDVMYAYLDPRIRYA